MRTIILAAIAAFAIASPTFAYQSGGHGITVRHPAQCQGRHGRVASCPQVRPDNAGKLRQAPTGVRPI
jgi:hypothetical protein